MCGVRNPWPSWQDEGCSGVLHVISPSRLLTCPTNVRLSHGPSVLFESFERLLLFCAFHQRLYVKYASTCAMTMLFPAILTENYLLDYVGIRKGMSFIMRTSETLECLYKKFRVRWNNLAQQSSDTRSLVSVTGSLCRQTMPPGWIGTQERKSLARRDFMF